MQQQLIGSAVALAAGGILLYAMQRRPKVKTIPLGEGWWGAGEKTTLSQDKKIHPFTVKTSDEEIKVVELSVACQLL